MHRRRLPLKWSNKEIKQKTREQSAMAMTKNIAHQITVVTEVDNESVATGMDATQCQSTGETARCTNSQGEKKKKKKGLPAVVTKADNEQDATAKEQVVAHKAPGAKVGLDFSMTTAKHDLVVEHST